MGLSKKATCLRGRVAVQPKLLNLFMNLFISIIKILKYYNINNITNSSQFARKYICFVKVFNFPDLF